MRMALQKALYRRLLYQKQGLATTCTYLVGHGQRNTKDNDKSIKFTL